MADIRSYFVPFDLDTGAGSELVVGVNLRVSASGGSIEAKGSQVSASSVPVVIASDQTAVAVDTELPAAAALADDTANPTVPGVGAFGMVYDGTTWDRMRGTSVDGVLVNLGANNDVTVTGAVDTELPAAAALTDNFANPTAPAVGSFGMLWDGATWDRAPGTSADGALVNLGANNDVTITGTPTVDTELPAAAALADDTANPTVPGVGSFQMGWDSANTNWNRVEVDDAGHLQVDVLTGGGTDTPANPVNNTQTSASVAVATPTDIDSAEAASKKLAWIDIWASVAYKAEIFTVDNGVESSRLGICGGPPHTYCPFRPTHREYIQLGATAGADNFRVKVTNLDDNQAADFHVVFHYED